LEIIFNSGKAIHSLKKSTRIVSNDSSKSETWVWIMADVMPKPDSNFSVQISPNILDFTTADLGESPEIEVKIRNTTISDLSIEIVDTPVEFVEGELSGKVIKPSEEVKLKVKLKREAENARLTKSITLELGDQDSSRFTVPVTSEKLPGRH
jgi:hypothetical protein